jgi:hypothetical protein
MANEKNEVGDHKVKFFAKGESASRQTNGGQAGGDG